MFFSVITKNLNWELRVQLLLRDEMGLKMKYFSSMGGSLKNPTFRVGVCQKTNMWEGVIA